MSLFTSSETASDESDLPIETIDRSKRYDLSSTRVGEDRLYENVKVVGVRVLRRSRFDSSTVIGGYIELEAPDGTRMMIPQNHIDMICKHAVKPIYKVIRGWGTRRKAVPHLARKAKAS